MRGIKEERLRELFRVQYNPPRDEYERGFNNCLAMLLTFECKELNPWLPIDENTPKDRSLLLYYPGRENDDDFDIPKIQSIGYWSFSLAIWVCDLKYCWGEEKSRLAQPTHYQELPDDPKE